MRKEQIDWQAYRKDLVGSLSNERLCALGSAPLDNTHLMNMADLEDEIEAIDSEDFDMILEKYEEFPDIFKDFLLPDSSFPTTDSNNPGKNR
ncbi:hypothetical protein DW228_06370 [Bacteroides fragilis]|uniref:Uncharacterized protein n=1 Tax=Bacteroides fragilis TaxID=817 RepID=A0A396C6S9_BACFG|nr:hypothetical protein [Bacteroides fragilis]RHH14422.1 hypothetical protein DW228_06370 [Bacteroides fragilis]